MKRVKTSKRDVPDLPAQFETVAELNGEAIDLEDAHVQGYDRAGTKIDTFRASGCLLEKVTLSGCELGSVVWKDVRLIGCDLANVRAHRMVLSRVEFLDCRLTGLTSRAVEWQDVLIRDGDARYAQLRDGKFRTCEFHGCDWQEADLHGCDLSCCVFRSCRLARADLQETNLKETDFRESEIETMQVRMNDVRGAIVEPAQAMLLARLLGLVIR